MWRVSVLLLAALICNWLIKAFIDSCPFRVASFLIDRMQHRKSPGVCEACEKRVATRRARFTAQYLQSTSTAIFDEESMVGVDLERRVCEDCLTRLQNAKNVTNLKFERL